MDSILQTIKKMLGELPEEYDCFDQELLIYINSAISTLTQLGVGPSEGFYVQDSSTTWNDFIPDDPRLMMVKTYIYLKVKIVFDPPSSSYILDSYQKTINELEWRLNVLCNNDENPSIEQDI